MNATVAAGRTELYTAPMRTHILEHINVLNPGDFIDLDDATASDVLSGQANTAAEFLARMGSPEHLVREDQAQAARNAFSAVTDVNIKDDDKKEALLTLRVPQAVKHLSGMLTQYDWDYIQQAKEIRGYVVAKVMEETKHPDAKIRLRALKLLGDVTEVGAFTERTEITKKDVTTSELEDRIRKKLASLLPKTVEIETVEPKTPSATT
jgi:hypothetical protein